MKTDRELLDLAAKAAGVALYWPDDATFDVGFALPLGPLRPNHKVREKRDWVTWNPLTDDGDALRLAVRLQLTIANEHVSAGAAYCTTEDGVFPDVNCAEGGSSEVLPSDYAATRRAIVLAAAEIGEAMP